MDKLDFSAASLLTPLQSDALRQGAKKTRAGSELKGKSKTRFSEILADSTPQAAELGPLRELAPSEEALEELLDAVHSAGSDLLDRPFHDEILRYKRAVRDFIHYVVENGYEIVKLTGIKKKIAVRGETEWKPLAYQQVRVIDQKLEELAAAILSGQTNQLERVSKIDEIRGLLVDLTITGVIRVRDE